MDIIFIDSHRFGYSHVTVSDSTKNIYQGKCGTIPVVSNDEYIIVEIKNEQYEKEKMTIGSSKILRLLLFVLVGLFQGYETQGLGRPYYFRIKVKKQLFMQLHYDDVFTHYFTSNVEIAQQRIKDKDYILFWIFSYIVPLQLITFFLAIMALIFLSTTLIAIIFAVVAIVGQMIVLFRLYDELK